MSTLFNEIDTMLSGGTPEPPPPVPPILAEGTVPGDLFSTYLLSPAYYTETPDMLAVKVVTAKGEPFYLLDPKKDLRDLVCGVTEVFLTPYNAETACVDECEGLPALHLIPSQIAGKLFKSLSCRKSLAGLIFVSAVSMQLFYRLSDCDTDWTTVVYRVATDREGHIEARENPGAMPCDYPVPYLLVNESMFAEGSEACGIVDLMGGANVSLVDSLCRLEYSYLHDAEQYPDELDESLQSFMGNHSHLVKGMLDKQLDCSCDDAFVRRERKKDIDTMVRLMMREIELIGQIKKNLEELAMINKAVGKCSLPPQDKACPPTKEPCEEEDDECEDPLLKPLLKLDVEKRNQALIDQSGINKFSEMMAAPLEDDDDDICVENAELLGSPSGSECSR